MADKSSYHIVVVELDNSLPTRFPGKPHLYVELSMSSPALRLKHLQQGRAPKFAAGKCVRLYKYAPKTRIHTDYSKAKAELKKCKEQLVRGGHALNGLAITWSQQWVVYVLDLDHSDKSEQMKNSDGSGKFGYVYVGQSSNSLEIRLAQHRRVMSSKSGRNIGARATKNRQIFGVLHNETVFSADHAKEREIALAKAWEARGYLVDAGHVTPHKLRKRSTKRESH